MAGYLTPVATAELLNRLAEIGTFVGLAQTLAESGSPTLANITEVAVAGYERVAVNWSMADENTLSISNTENLQFGPVTEDMPPAGYAFLTNVQTGDTLDAPTNLKATAAGSGGNFAAGQYYWVVSALNDLGETEVSNEVTVTAVDSDSVTLTWDAVDGATGYNVYRGTSANGENVLVATVSDPSFTDTGESGTSSDIPAVNTASVGNVYYVWELAEPVDALANKPIYVPTSGLIIE